jgi:hypothetical protein
MNNENHTKAAPVHQLVGPVLLAKAQLRAMEAEHRVEKLQLLLAECASVMADAVHTLENHDEEDWRRGSINLLNKTIDDIQQSMWPNAKDQGADK